MWFKHCLPVQPGSSHVGLSLYYFSIYQVRWKWNYCLSLLRGKTFVEVGCWAHSEVSSRGIYALCISLMLHILGHKERTCLSLPLNSDGSDTSETDNGRGVFTKGFIPLHGLSVFSLWKEISSELYHFSWELLWFKIFVSIRRWHAWESTMLTDINMQYSVPFARMLINT